MYDHNGDDDCNDTPWLKIAKGVDDLDPDEKRKYWKKLETTLRNVFNIKKNDALKLCQEYKDRLHSANADFFAYHIDPLQAAADLVECKIITTEHKISYTKVLASENSAEKLPERDALSYDVPEEGWPRQRDIFPAH